MTSIQKELFFLLATTACTLACTLDHTSWSPTQTPYELSVATVRSKLNMQQVGNKIFRQMIGIPMGTDCVAPLLANLFLFYYEYKFMKEKSKQNNQVVKIFSNTFRYIDDLLTLNNPTFEQEISNIYIHGKEN